MDLKLIEDALALLETKNLTRAAARRNVTQPAFSRRIRALEEWIGVPLLDRQTNRVTLLPGLLENEGEFRAVLARLKQFRDTIAQSRRGERSMVLATQHALAASTVPSVFRHFRNLDAGLNWHIRALNREDCISVFLRGDADVLLTYEAPGFPPLPFDNSIVKHLWMRDMLLPVAGDQLRKSLGPDRTVPVNMPVIVYPPSSHFGRLLDQSGVDLTGGPARATIGTDFTVGARELVREGIGVGWLPHSMCRRDIKSGRMISLRDRYGHIPIDARVFAASGNPLASQLISSIAPATGGSSEEPRHRTMIW